MARIDELKKQFPELNTTVFDLFRRIDTSSTYKYFPLLCKIFGKRFDMEYQYEFYESNSQDRKLEIHESMLSRGISTDNTTDNELYFLNYMSEFYDDDVFHSIKDFIRYMDRNKIKNKDVTSYSSITQVREAVTLVIMKELEEELKSQVIKEYEDEKWLAVRPLTFQASAKYGASTRWCTTYQKEKQYFEKYWQNGILVYFINKQTGYKFAGYKALHYDNELSFWNAEDSRIDYLSVTADDYLYSVVKKILSSDKTNKNLSSVEIQQQVSKECGYNVKRISSLSDEDEVMTYPTDPTPVENRVYTGAERRAALIALTNGITESPNDDIVEVNLGV